MTSGHESTKKISGDVVSSADGSPMHSLVASGCEILGIPESVIRSVIAADDGFRAFIVQMSRSSAQNSHGGDAGSSLLDRAEQLLAQHRASAISKNQGMHTVDKR